MTLTHPIESKGRSSFPPESLKIPADKVKSAIGWMAEQPDIPITVANAMYATMWLLNVEAFRAKEDEFMLAGKYDECLEDHRATLAILIADGEAVILATKKNGMANTPTNFTIEDIQATLNSLHTTFFCEHGPKNSPKMNKIIEGLFDGATA